MKKFKEFLNEKEMTNESWFNINPDSDTLDKLLKFIKSGCELNVIDTYFSHDKGYIEFNLYPEGRKNKNRIDDPYNEEDWENDNDHFLIRVEKDYIWGGLYIAPSKFKKYRVYLDNQKLNISNLKSKKMWMLMCKKINGG